MQKISSVLKVSLTVQKRTCVTGDDESRGTFTCIHPAAMYIADLALEWLPCK